MQRLDRLDVLSRKILAGKLQGERRSKKKGQSVEFADYRSYVVGDDLRFIDWNLYARLDKLFLRLFMEEKDLSVTIALDISASMDYGNPNKLNYAKRVAAALGYIGLTHYNRVNLYTFAHTLVDMAQGMRGRRPVPRMLDFLQKQHAATGEQTSGNLVASCKRLALLQRQPGVMILLSDFFDKGDLNQALRYLAGDKHDVYAIQLLAPQEVDPAIGNVLGDLRLQDIEDGNIAEVSVGPTLLKRYRANLQAYCQFVRQECMKRGIAYLASETDVPFDRLMLKYLRQKGLLG